MSELLSKISSTTRTWIVSVMLIWKELLAKSISYLSITPLPLHFFPFPISILMMSEKQLKWKLLVMHCILVLLTLNLLSGSSCKGVIQGVKKWYSKTSVYPSILPYTSSSPAPLLPLGTPNPALYQSTTQL